MTAPLKILVLGATGRLGQALLRRYRAQGLEVRGLSRAQADLSKPEALAVTLAGESFDVLINTAGITDVDYCESHAASAFVANATAPGLLAALCQARGARFVQLSSDYVFAGEVHTPRTEEDVTKPSNVYGQSKLQAEKAVLAAQPNALVLRVSWLFGLEKPSFPDRIIREAQERLDVSAVNDKWACPTFADDLCEWLLALLQAPEARGVYHVVNAGHCTWQEYGERTLALAREIGIPVKTTKVRGHSMQGFAPFLAQRPPFTALDTSRFTAATGLQPRSWEAALEDYLRQKYLA
jgi:dTDP-4-dehydrorhamnose reductase